MTITRDHANANPGWGPISRELVTDPTNYRKLKNGCLWLLLYVTASANPRTGRLQTTWSTVAAETGLDEQHLRSMAGHLRIKGYCDVHGQGADQVLFVLRKCWRPVHLRSMLESERRRKAVMAGDGTPGQSDIPPLAREVVQALGEEEHLEDVIELVGQYPESLIRNRLEDVVAVPNEKIRVSRFALLRFLLRKHDNHNDNAAA